MSYATHPDGYEFLACVVGAGDEPDKIAAHTCERGWFLTPFTPDATFNVFVTQGAAHFALRQLCTDDEFARSFVAIIYPEHDYRYGAGDGLEGAFARAAAKLKAP